MNQISRVDDWVRDEIRHTSLFERYSNYTRPVGGFEYSNFVQRRVVAHFQTTVLHKQSPLFRVRVHLFSPRAARCWNEIRISPFLLAGRRRAAHVKSRGGTSREAKSMKKGC